MSFLGEWIKHIVLLILIASFLDLILPNSSMRKYVKLVVGFLLILLILSPILQIFQFDHERLLSSLDELLTAEDRKTQQQLEKEQKNIEALQDQLLLEEVEQLWKEEIKAGVEAEFDLEVSDVNLRLDINKEHASLTAVQLTVNQPEAEAEDKTAEERDSFVHVVRPIEPIVEVNVHLAKKSGAEPLEMEISAQQKKLEKEVLKFVQTEWNISVDKIHIAWSRG